MSGQCIKACSNKCYYPKQRIIHYFPGAKLCPTSILSDPFKGLKYFAISPDKTLLACANGNCITLLETSSFEKVFGPFDVEKRLQTPFGIYTRWQLCVLWRTWQVALTVQRRCVEEFSQFSGNSEWYQWGSFILDERYIVVEKYAAKHTLDCLRTIFNIHIAKGGWWWKLQYIWSYIDIS